MKRILILSLAFLFSGFLFAQNGYDLSYQQTSQEIEITFDLGNYDVTRIKKDNDEFSNIVFDGSIVTTKKGFAELPYIHASVMLALDKNYSLEIIEADYEDISLNYPMLPSRGVIYRNQHPDDIPYVIDNESIIDAFYPEDIAVQTDPFIIRDIRGTNVYVHPFRYNAVQNILRVYKSVRVKLTQNNTTPINPLFNQSESIVREFDGIYNSIFLNYEANRDDLTIGQYGDILVICTSRDEAAIEPFIQWKKEKGYNVTKEVVSTGTNVTSLIQTAYDNNNDLLYVQLVGDWPDIKSNTLNGGAPPMDPQLGCVVGSDTYADICIGRFSSNNASHVTLQVDKTIAYEKTPEMGGTWYDVATGVASAEGPGDDNEYDIAHNNVIYNDKLDPFTYNSFNTIYDPGASISNVNIAVNGGTSVINYTGHGSATSWGTTGFNNSSAQNLSNGSKLPFVVSVACNNGDFHRTSGDCFAEAWMKNDNGAIVFLGASISQPWDPPMRGQDYFMDALIGGYDYTAHAGQNGISTTEQRTTIGAMVFNGLTLMCTEAGANQDWETAKTWNTFGDPSLQLRTAAPEVMALSNTTIMVGVDFATTVSAGVGPFEGAMVTISQGGNYFTAITDASGSVTIPQTFTPGDALLVVTGFNLETIYQTVTVAPSGGAFVIYEYHDINDAAGNNNGVIDYNETVKLGLALTNVGTSEATNVDVSLSTVDVYTTIIDGTEVFGTIGIGETVYLADVFEISVGADVPDMHNLAFDLVSTGDASWNSSFSDMAHAPALGFVSCIVSDPNGNANGKLDPGETAELFVTVENAGSSEAYNVVGELSSTSAYIDIVQSNMNYGQITGGNNAVQTFEVTADAATPAGHSASFDFDMTADHGISAAHNFFMVIGQIPVIVVDLDGNNNSADAMMACFANLGVGAEMQTTFPSDLNLYGSVFVCLGVYADNHVLSTTEGQQLADYLNTGGNLYMEGGDTWFYDDATAVHPLFGITGTEDGGGDLGNIQGQAGTFTEGMDYTYSGDNNWIDHMTATGSAFVIFENQTPGYVTAVANEGSTYKTIGASHEFGGLDDGTFTKDDLMKEYLIFFGIDGIWTGVDDGASNHTDVAIYPNPAYTNARVALSLESPANVSIELYNQQGQNMYSISEREFSEGNHVVDLKEISTFNAGIYFVRITTGNKITTKKLVIMH
ncbi:C25 family cysteine peptidase [Bacteroidota bacterium]